MNTTTQPSALILGATGGVGQALAELLLERGWSLLLGGRDPAKLRDLGARLGAPTVEVDARDWEAVDAAVQDATQRFGRLDGVANLAGSLLLKPAHLTREADYREVLDVNLGSAFACVRAAARTLGGPTPVGSLVLVSSAAASVGLANHEAIAAAKAGVEGLARSAAATYAPKGLRINAVAPGLTKTPLTRRLWESERAAAASAALHPLGFLGEPAHVASAIAWLLEPEQAWVTGQVLGVDGGLASLRVAPQVQRPTAQA
ncbi:MAG: SDR family oxidoreductase [Planctomycetes bacterium]|nr:SDR family oxidoreductase [Planctomycetota bacterium]